MNPPFSACLKRRKMNQDGGVQMRFGLPRYQRLRNRRQFRTVYLRGQSIKGPRLIICYLPNGLNFNRLGLSTSKKNFKLSVTRHYVQRRLREAYRLQQSDVMLGLDIVICARRHKKEDFNLREAGKELFGLLRKAGLLVAKERNADANKVVNFCD